MPFKYIIWSCIGTSFALGVTLLLYLKFAKPYQRNFIIGKNNSNPFLNMMNVFLGNSTNYLPIRNFARTLLLIWTFACIVLRNSYQGKLFNILQKQTKVAPLSTLDQLINANYRLYTLKSSYHLFDSLPRIQSRYEKSLKSHRFFV